MRTWGLEFKICNHKVIEVLATGSNTKPRSHTYTINSYFTMESKKNGGKPVLNIKSLKF